MSLVLEAGEVFMCSAAFRSSFIEFQAKQLALFTYLTSLPTLSTLLSELSASVVLCHGFGNIIKRVFFLHTLQMIRGCIIKASRFAKSWEFLQSSICIFACSYQLVDSLDSAISLKACWINSSNFSVDEKKCQSVSQSTSPFANIIACWYQKYNHWVTVLKTKMSMRVRWDTQSWRGGGQLKKMIRYSNKPCIIIVGQVVCFSRSQQENYIF